MDGGNLQNPFPTHRNFVLTGTQGTLLYTDGNFIGEIFPTTSFTTGVANIQSYAKYTPSTTVAASISVLIDGSIPYSGGTRIPAVFFTDDSGTLPTALTDTTVYYIDYTPGTGLFSVYASSTSTSALDISTGATGNQYFNTFFPLGPDAGVNGTHTTLQYTAQRVNLPFYEITNCLLEVDNTVYIGCKSNMLYPWNQVDALPSDVIALPESNVQAMLNVNNMAYIFAGTKGNVYITNGSVASLVIKVPDYVAGVPGTVSSYVEPTFTWGDATFIRGRVYFSILDQTSAKAGNCGGVWSFVPTENLYIGADTGIALRLENQNSYGTYNGYAPILIGSLDQSGLAPKYWSAWQDSYNTATANFGIDYSAATPVTNYTVETDLLPVGTYLDKQTFTQLEYKLATIPNSGESVQLYWRGDGTDTWTSAGSVITDTSNAYGAYFQVNFEKNQWLQFRAVATTDGTATSSFVPLVEIRLR